MDGLGLGDGRTHQARDQLWRDGADLGELEGGVAKRTVVDGDLDAFGALSLLDKRAGATDPGDDPAQLFVEVEALEVFLDRIGVTERDSGEDLVQGLWTAHLLHLLQDHRGQLAVAFRKDGIRPLGQGEKQGRPAAAAALGLAHDQAFSLEVGQVLSNRVGGDAEIVGYGFRAAAALAPQ
jgi:hypothetical protein